MNGILETSQKGMVTDLNDRVRRGDLPKDPEDEAVPFGNHEPDPEWVAHVDAAGDQPPESGVEGAPDPTPLVSLMPYDDLFVAEQEVTTVVSALGLAPGVISAIFAAGFVGKTIVALTIGLCTASGRALFGLFSVIRGRWLHLDYEQGKRHTKRRIVRLMRGMGLDREEMRGWFDIAIFPRLNLTTRGAEELFAQLFTGYSIVTIDAMRGLIPGVDENGAEVRDFLDMLSRAGERAGAVVLILHHAGKPAADGKRARRDMGRGSSAIFDACQTVFVATAEKGDPQIYVSHEKDRELGRLVDDFSLRIEDVEIEGDPKGGLRVVHLDREQLTPKRATDTLAVLIGRVIEVVKAHPGCSTRVVRAEVKGARAVEVDAALDEAVRRKLLQNLGSDRKSEWRAIGGAS